MSDTRAQIAAVLAAHIPNHDYDGCRCSHERTGEPAWREHLAAVLEPLTNSPGFAALVTGQMLWVCEQAKRMITDSLVSPSARPIAWVVEEPSDHDDPTRIGWATSPERARALAAEYWRFADWHRPTILIYPKRMDTAAFADSHALVDGFEFDGDAIDARKAGWLDDEGYADATWTEPPRCEHCRNELPAEGECPCRERERVRARNADETMAAIRELAAQPVNIANIVPTRRCETHGCDYIVVAADQETVDAEYAKHLATDPRHTDSEWTDRDGRTRRGLEQP